MLQKIRRILAIIFFVLVTSLFLDFTGTMKIWFGWMAKVQFLPAILALNFAIVLALLILTLIMGRIYCSIICPLGVFQDIVIWFHGKKKRNPYTFSKSISWLRYTMLIVMIIALVAGIASLAALLEPYSAFGRMANNLFQPIYLLCNNGLAALAEHFNSYTFYHTDIWLKSLPTFIVAIITFVAIIILAWRGGRTYCNTICPVGTFLGLISRFSWFKIHINTDKCVNCGLCARNCKASCLDAKHHHIDYSRCVACGDCIGKCSSNAITFSHLPSKSIGNQQQDAKTPDNKSAVDNGKRMFLFGSAIATTTALLGQKQKKLDGGLALIANKVEPQRTTPLSPPGAISQAHFAQHCTACQLCISECPNNVLRPSTDLLHLMQPTMQYERGYCRPECTRCSEVCPTGAIHLISKAEKSSIQIGHAVWIRKNCVAVTDHVMCGNCARHCPVGAIEMVPENQDDVNAPIIPAINEARCIGCGACENLCPARPFTAIYVEGHEQHKTL
jgi:ferredoxin